MLPRWSYVCLGGGQAAIQVAIDPRDRSKSGLRDRFREELEAILSALAQPLAEDGWDVTRCEQMECPRWGALVDEIKALVQSGKAEKVVASRRADIRLNRAPSLQAILRRMGHSQGQSTCFGVNLGRKAFVGVTPETLFSKAGDLFATHALAGTAECRGDVSRARAGEALLASEKDRLEHEFVVARIRDVMRPLCAVLAHEQLPSLRPAGNLQHLQTSFAGKLAAGVGACDLLAALHPTPAVGGSPSEAALQWIAEREPAPRGWYSGAVGWFDLSGDATFAVAIRSGVVAQDKVYVFAGAGIVERSEAESEYRETSNKQAAMLKGLGLRRDDSGAWGRDPDAPLRTRLGGAKARIVRTSYITPKEEQ
jgi:isochorismate synthase